jgi:hypothetical protein
MASKESIDWEIPGINMIDQGLPSGEGKNTVNENTKVSSAR